MRGFFGLDISAHICTYKHIYTQFLTLKYIYIYIYIYIHQHSPISNTFTSTNKQQLLSRRDSKPSSLYKRFQAVPLTAPVIASAAEY